MSTNAGALLWNRKHITLPTGATEVDTGLRQVSQAFGNSSINEPPLDPAVGVGSRVQVIPLPPTSGWSTISIDEPFLSPVTGTIHVVFHNTSEVTQNVNALFWDPDTKIGPGQADTYNVIT